MGCGGPIRTWSRYPWHDRCLRAMRAEERPSIRELIRERQRDA